MASTNPDPCELLKWDTDFFGFRIAKVQGDALTPERARQIDAWCRQAAIRCLYFLGRADDVVTSRAAEDNGFRLVDVRLTFARKIPIDSEELKGYTNGSVVRPICPADMSALRDVARRSYRDSRFHFDTGFPRHLSDSLYGLWLERSCEGYAQAVLVAELDGVPMGYITCHIDQEPYRGRIGLVGVNSQVQGRGTGQTLVFNALKWFSTQQVPEAQVVTQGRNCTAQRLYQRCGFLTQSVQLWYHKWYPPAEAVHE
jgi:dTDP-4-amino-4,6-dideoxy-D-galactose acyltransferase